MKLQALLGFARAAGKLEVGRVACRKAVQIGRAKALVIASDASPSTLADIEKLGEAFGVKVYQVDAAMSELGQMVGRPPVAVVCITDRHFAAELKKLIGSKNS